MGVALYIHDHRKMIFGTINQNCSQDLDLNTTAYAYRPIKAGRTERFLSLFIPYNLSTPAGAIIRDVKSSINKKGKFRVSIGDVMVEMDGEGNWLVSR